MASFEKLPASAFLKASRPTRGSYLPEYRDYLADLSSGEGGEITLEEGEKKATIKNRLRHAARLEDKNLRYLRASADRVRFQITDA